VKEEMDELRDFDVVDGDLGSPGVVITKSFCRVFSLSFTLHTPTP
jgi:hypothetical protein